MLPSLSLSDFQSRVRQVQIKEPPQDLPKATVDDIRASVQTLKLGNQHSPSTRIRKATSSQSLNSEQDRYVHTCNIHNMALYIVLLPCGNIHVSINVCIVCIVCVCVCVW